MKLKSPLLFFFLISGFFNAKGQDTLFYKGDGNQTTSLANAETYKIITYAGLEKDIETEERIFYKNGQLKHQTFYSNYEKKTREGRRVTWREDGSKMREVFFKKGKLQGLFTSFWPNGQMKRKDTFRNGKLKQGKVWNNEGVEEEYYPLEKGAEFPGGKLAMLNFIKAEINPVKGLTGKVVVNFTVDKTGTIRDIQINEDGNLELKLEAYRLVKSMPAWSPGKFDGEPVNTFYSLPIVFQ